MTGTSGGRFSTILTCDGANCIKARSTFDTILENFQINATTNVPVATYLIDLQHKPATSVDTRQVTLRHLTLDGNGSASGGTYNVNGIQAYQISSLYVENCTLLRLTSGIKGQASGSPSGTNFSNDLTINNTTFSGMIGYPLVNPGQNWTIIGGYTQVLSGTSGFLSDGRGRVLYSDPANTWQNVVFINHPVYDTTVNGSNYIDVGTGTNMQIIGGLWGGINGSNLLIARGVVSGLKISAQASNFEYIAYANVAGQLNWSFSGLNKCDNPAGTTGCSLNLVGLPANVSNLNTDGVTPNSSQGVNSQNGWRINPDGTKEVWGQVAIAAIGAQTITFNSAFGTACYNTVAIMQSPGTVSNVLSLTGSCSTTGQAIYISGAAGTTTVSYRAIGR